MFLLFMSGWFCVFGWDQHELCWVSCFNDALSQVSGVLWCCLSRLAHSGTFHLTESCWILLLCWLPSDSDCQLYWGLNPALHRTLWIRCSVSRVEGCSHVHYVCKPIEKLLKCIVRILIIMRIIMCYFDWHYEKNCIII